ncbi:MAG: hypothetical protein KC656_05485 [Myxococcales bacterium]|nr:hypothetical protein [Myxococcales bacterium]MCB9668236.1 hypothetical protein [Alphaproteobacteria bacterium]MCB9692576.1 hypothetical protein [Alphaproteobacteria bacterium]
MRSVLLLVPLVAGCYSQYDYVTTKTDTFCSWLLECTDPSVLAFDGMNMEVCQGFWGPRFEEEGLECKKFKRGVAKQCIEALELATCPADGSPVSDNIPEVCDFVYLRCEPQALEEPEPTDG